MKRRFYLIATAVILLSLCPFFQVLIAQTEQQKLFTIILSKDSLFWESYNNCDTEKFKQFFTDDVEFYHDKGGLTNGLENLTASFKKNLCDNDSFGLRREAVAGTVKVFPLQKSNLIYGAIISGEHVFYVLDKNKKERLDGLAKFTHVWILKDSVWKMNRVLSYDHGPAPYINKRKEIKISAKILNQFVGEYKGAQTGKLIFRNENDLLTLINKNKKSTLYPEGQNLFFMKEQDLTFEFIKNGQNKVYRLLVREHGEIVEELTLLK